MIDLAKNYGDKKPLSLKSIARDHELSEHYLEQLIPPLRNAGFVRSVRGAYGGYLLTKSPEDITAGDVIRILEGPIFIVEGIEEEEPAKKELWVRIRNAVKDVLDTTTLADMANFEDNENLHGYMFYI